MDYALYKETNLSSYHFKGDEMLRKQFNEYVHLDEDEYNNVIAFASKYDMKLNFRQTCFSICFDKTQTLKKLFFETDLDVLNTSVKKLAIVKSSVNSTNLISIYLKRTSKCGDESNLSILKKWFTPETKS